VPLSTICHLFVTRAFRPPSEASKLGLLLTKHDLSGMANELLDDFLIPSNRSGRRQRRVLMDGRVVEFEPVENTRGLDHHLMLDGRKAPDGRYTLNDGVTRFEVLKGAVVQEYYIERFKHQEGTILVDCSTINGFDIGCMAYRDKEPLPNGVYQLKLFKWIQVRDGTISRTSIFKIQE